MKRTPYKWLDLRALCVRLLSPPATLHRIRYFTALVKSDAKDPQRAQRQQFYLRALATIPNLTIHYGHFLETQPRMPLARPTLFGPKTVQVIKTEEKGSDVNLASWLIFDGCKGDYEQAVVVTNDSDLVEPIKIVRYQLSLPVGVWNPHTQATMNREFAAFVQPAGATPRKATPSIALRKVSKFRKDITSDGATSHVAMSQFPVNLTDAAGTFSKPAGW